MNYILLLLIGICFVIFGIVFKEDKKTKKLLIVSGAILAGCSLLVMLLMFAMFYFSTAAM